MHTQNLRHVVYSLIGIDTIYNSFKLKNLAYER